MRPTTTPMRVYRGKSNVLVGTTPQFTTNLNLKRKSLEIKPDIGVLQGYSYKTLKNVPNIYGNIQRFNTEIDLRNINSARSLQSCKTVLTTPRKIQNISRPIKSQSSVRSRRSSNPQNLLSKPKPKEWWTGTHFVNKIVNSPINQINLNKYKTLWTPQKIHLERIFTIPTNEQEKLNKKPVQKFMHFGGEMLYLDKRYQKMLCEFKPGFEEANKTENIAKSLQLVAQLRSISPIKRKIENIIKKKKYGNNKIKNNNKDQENLSTDRSFAKVLETLDA